MLLPKYFQMLLPKYWNRTIKKVGTIVFHGIPFLFHVQFEGKDEDKI
jgi:hypothetical protein